MHLPYISDQHDSAKPELDFCGIVITCRDVLVPARVKQLFYDISECQMARITLTVWDIPPCNMADGSEHSSERETSSVPKVVTLLENVPHTTKLHGLMLRKVMILGLS